MRSLVDSLTDTLNFGGREIIMLSTIGYESAQLSHFIGTLQTAGVEILVDVRDRAQSRRKGFSKTALSDALKAAGIDYLHLRELGDPKAGREAARAGEWKKFRKIYDEVVASIAAQEALDEIELIVEKQHACLLCYERDPGTCHRSIVADIVAGRIGLKPQHLGVREIEPVFEQSGRVLYSRQSAAA